MTPSDTLPTEPLPERGGGCLYAYVSVRTGVPLRRGVNLGQSKTVLQIVSTLVYPGPPPLPSQL